MQFGLTQTVELCKESDGSHADDGEENEQVKRHCLLVPDPSKRVLLLLLWLWVFIFSIRKTGHKRLRLDRF